MLKEPVSECGQCPLGKDSLCRFKPRAHAAGTHMWSQGQEQAELVFVKEGVLGVSTTDSEGRELSAGVRGPRSLLGLEALRGETARTTAVALVPTTVCMAAVEGLRGHLSLEETSTLLDFALDELGQTNRDRDLRTGSALSRVARFLLRYGSLVAPGKRAPFSKQHVAQLLALRPETMSRCLKALEERGAIDAKEIKVIDLACLEGIANGHDFQDDSERHGRGSE